MTAAIIGLIGAVFGATVALFGAALSDRRQARIQDARSKRDQRAAAYESAIRCLNGAAHRRSELLFGATGARALLGGDQAADWLHDLSEALCSLRLLMTCCRSSQLPRIREVVEVLEGASRDLSRGTSREVRWPAGRADEVMRQRDLRCLVIEPTNPTGIEPIMRAMTWALEVVTNCARVDSDGAIDSGGQRRLQLPPGTSQ